MLRTLRSLGSLPRRNFTTIAVDGESVSIPALRASFPFIWLRDSCQCLSCIHPGTRHKGHRSADFARAVRVVKPEAVDVVDGGLRVKWKKTDENGDLGALHESFYTAEFLARYASSDGLVAFHRDVIPEPWVVSQIESRPTIQYTELQKPEVLLGVYKQLLRDGMVFLSGVPTAETMDEKCELRTLAGRLGETRKTFYGELFDVRNRQNSNNIAYTNRDLEFHMDLLYFKEPPRYQILHSLRNRVRGGQSLFVDALSAAYQISATSPDSFTLLSNISIPFHHLHAGHHLHNARPTFELSQPNPNSDDTLASRIKSINYAPPFQAPLPPSTPPALYDALAELARRLEDPKARVTRLLAEGDAVVFDNRRILHARAGFEEMEDVVEGETNRWLKGCYLEEDPVLDRMRMLSAELDK